MQPSRRGAVVAQDRPYRYQELAAFITRLVDGGTLLPGSRVPSLRQISRERGTSLATALQAYRLLEDRGLLEARPQSGFYVARRARASLEAPAISKPPPTARAVSVSAVVLRLFEYASDPSLVPLGCAVPSANLLGAGRLDRLLARMARNRGIERNVYTLPRGDQALRRELARRAARWGGALSPEDIVLTYGCTEALTLALQAVARPGDTIAIESPAYFGILHTIEILNLRALELPTDPFTGVDPGALEQALRERSVKACLLSSSFNNPLGCTSSDARKVELLRLLTRHRVPLIEDDIYGDIFFGERRPTPFSVLDPAADVIYCSSFSKTVAPGYRMGWMAPGRHMQRVLERKMAFTLSGLPLAQGAFADYLASGGYDRHLRRIRGVFRDNLERMSQAISRFFPEGTRVSRPAGGFVLWVELPKRVDTRELFGAALERGICIAPGDVFSASRRYAHCMRLSGGAQWSARIERALETLGGMVQEVARSSSGAARKIDSGRNAVNTSM
jgi:DNA-binding transcriptional MocR family regulator